MLELNSTTIDFYFKSGQVAKSLPDLLLILIDMGDEEFLEHAQKNYFSQWVEHALHNALLAQKIRGIQNKRELIQALKTALPGRSGSPAPKTQPSPTPKPNVLVPDFDLESGHTVQVPSTEKQIEAWCLTI